MKELCAGNKSMSVADVDWEKGAAFEDAVTGSYKGNIFESGKQAGLYPNNRILRAAMVE